MNDINLFIGLILIICFIQCIFIVLCFDTVNHRIYILSDSLEKSINSMFERLREDIKNGKI